MSTGEGLPKRAIVYREGDDVVIGKPKKDHEGQRGIKLTHIRISGESDAYQDGHNYAGFILYAHGDPVKTDWYLNGKHCKTGYLVIQDSSKKEVQRYIGKAEGMIHGAIYKNVFKEDVGNAVGEAFAYRGGVFTWRSSTFNARSDGYHDKHREMAAITECCVGYVLQQWKESRGRLPSCRTYEVKNILKAQ